MTTTKTQTKKKTKKTYKTTRKIRGEKRRVEITRKKNGKETIRILKKKTVGKKPRLKRIKISSSMAENVQSSRSGKSRNLDSRTTSKKLVKDSRWISNPGKFDYPGVDTKGEGKDPHYEYKMDRKKKREKEKKRGHANNRMINNTRELRWELHTLKDTTDPKKKKNKRKKIKTLKRKINKDNRRAAKLQ